MTVFKKKRPLIENPQRGKTQMWEIPAQYAPGHEDWCEKDKKHLKWFGWGSWCTACKRRIS